MNAALSPLEAQRLASLRRYEVLDTPPEQAFDDLALLAAQICQVPTAMVSFVDDKRQWFKARTGMTTAETSREIAFCAHTILHADEVLEVHDARLDPRFSDNPLVNSAPFFRFYAGAPLVAPDGHALGALCVMDSTPHVLTSEQRAALRALGRHVVGQLELRRQARALETEIVERGRAEVRLREQCEQLAERDQVAAKLLALGEKSRRALLSVLEDEKRAGQKLRDSEGRFRQLAENIHEVFWMTDPAKNTMLYVSPAYAAIWGRTCESLYANPMNWASAIHPDDRERVLAAALNQRDGGAYDEDYRIVRPDGSLRWIHDRAFPVRNEAGDIYRIVGTAEDITERKRAELRTAVQHAVTTVLSEAAPLPTTASRILDVIGRQLEWDWGVVWTVDRTTKTLRCVELWHSTSADFTAFAKMSRMMTFKAGEGLAGRVWSEKAPLWIPEVSKEPAFLRREPARVLGLRGALAFPIKLRNEVLGVMEFFSLRSQPPDEKMLAMYAVLGIQIGQFIERKQLEDQFRQAQKMEAIGTLAGGIAHDFNNVLAAILGYTDLAAMEVRDKPLVREYLQAVSKAGGRAADLVRQILSFSRQQEQQRKVIQLRPVVEEALKLLRATIPATVAFDVTLERSGPSVLADATQIHQIVMNLATNAAHAMKERPGRLSVNLESVDVDADLAAMHPGLRPGGYLRLDVGDTGHGMDAATVSRIFDPFFTTKAPGEGTGLGLAVVHGIMQSHEGVVTVYSQPGEGTRFHLYFPAHVHEAREAVVPVARIPHGHGERILVIDDEPPLALMIKRMLEGLGYIIDAFTAPADAVSAVRMAPIKYSLVITDLTMPGMTGIDVAELLLGIRPGLPIILTTGYSATLTLDRVQAMGIQTLLLKPLTAAVLGEAVHKMLAKTKP